MPFTILAHPILYHPILYHNRFEIPDFRQITKILFQLNLKSPRQWSFVYKRCMLFHPIQKKSVGIKYLYGVCVHDIPDHHHYFFFLLCRSFIHVHEADNVPPHTFFLLRYSCCHVPLNYKMGLLYKDFSLNSPE